MSGRNQNTKPQKSGARQQLAKLIETEAGRNWPHTQQLNAKRMDNLHQDIRVLGGFAAGKGEERVEIDFSSRNAFVKSAVARHEEWMQNGAPVGLDQTMLPANHLVGALLNTNNSSDVHVTANVQFVGAPFLGMCPCCIGRSKNRAVIEQTELKATTANALDLPDGFCEETRDRPQLSLAWLSPISLIDVTQTTMINDKNGKDSFKTTSRIYRACIWCFRELRKDEGKFLKLAKAMNPEITMPKRQDKGGKTVSLKKPSPTSAIKNMMRNLDDKTIDDVMQAVNIITSRGDSTAKKTDMFLTLTTTREDAIATATQLA